MKKILFTLCVILHSGIIFAQTDSLLTWNIEAKKIQTNVYELTATGSIPLGWHLYAVNPTIDGLETVKFSFDYEGAQTKDSVKFNKASSEISDLIFEKKKVNIFTGSVTAKQFVQINGTIPEHLKGRITAFLGKNDEFVPLEQIIDVVLQGGSSVAGNATRIALASVDINNPIINCGAKNEIVKSSLWSVFFLGFVGGLIALLTPCVFPMIPVTVSFFTNRAKDRRQAITNGLLYGLFIFLIYTLASTPFHLLSVQPEIFNSISTNSWLNVFFFAIFLFFSISFFGYFEISLPSSIAGKADSKSGLGSIGGIFFMAVTLAIVSFSCTGPILGSLLVGSLSGGAWPLTAGLAGFGFALALPFAVFAIFPQLLKSLPKSGGWLDTVKKVLAFVELGLAFKFLSNADLVMHWGLLKREVFIGIWILISAGLTLYLFGLIHFPHDTKGVKLSVGRKIFGVIILLFTLYLIPGVTATKYANLQLLSGFPPPLNYSIYGIDNTKGKGLEADVRNDYDKALALAKEQHKPLLIDFTGWACVNCRKMEETVWTQPEVYNYIKQNFILVSLYVDDREKLPILNQFTYTKKDGTKKEIISVGDKWATFEAENFNQVTQPLYVILDNNERLINNPVGFTPSISEYLNWLKCGKENFKVVE